MGLAVVLSGFACYQQVGPMGLDKDVRAPEKWEMRTACTRRFAGD